jgi:hypothetical protein
MFSEKLAKLPQPARIMIAAVAVIVPAAVCYSWIVAPHTTYLSATRQYKLVVGDVAKRNQIIKTKTARKTIELKKLREGLEINREKFFTPSEAQKFFRDIETISNQSGCTITSTNFLATDSKSKTEKRATDKTYAIITNGAVVNFVSNYENTIKFLAKILDRPQTVSVESLEMALVGPKLKKLECEVTFKIFIINDKEIFSNE